MLHWPESEATELSACTLILIIRYHYQCDTVSLHKLPCNWIYRRFQRHLVNSEPRYPYIVMNCGISLDSWSIQSSSGKGTSIVHNFSLCIIYCIWSTRILGKSLLWNNSHLERLMIINCILSPGTEQELYQPPRIKLQQIIHMRCKCTSCNSIYSLWVTSEKALVQP